jgi:ABC-2 type transport system permease protein
MATLDIPIPRILDEQVLTSTLASATTAQSRPTRPSALSASLTLGWRAMLKLKHGPSQLVEVSVWPILMTLMFTYLFGGAIAGSVKEYLQHLIPGMFVLAVAMISQYTALALNTDITKGIFDRFRSLPFWRPAVLVGAFFGDMVRYTLAAIVVIVLGLILGFRPQAGLVGVLSSLGIVLVFTFSLSWIWTTVGLLMDRAESVSMVSGIVNFLLMFISNVFVDPATMPGFLRQYVRINPFGLTVTAVRGLMHGNVTTSQIGYVLLSCAILIAIFAPLTMVLYNNKNAD